MRLRLRMWVMILCAMLATAPGVPARDGETGLADVSPARLKHRIDEILIKELTEHWYPHAVDRQRGGFHQNMARDWALLPDDNVMVVYQARMTWTAAAFARYSERHKEEFVGYARHGIEFLDRVLRDPDAGGFHWALDASGRLDLRQGDEKHLYGTAFVIYAGSTVRQLTGDDRALAVARDAFDWLEQHAHDAKHGGYFEALRRDGTPIMTWDQSDSSSRRVDRLGVYHGFKSMNAHIHLLEALTELAKVDARPVVQDRLREVFQVVLKRIAVEPGALNLYLTPDWRAIPAHDSFGHDVETAFLLVEAAHARGTPDDPEAWQMARLLVDHALEWGWDDQHGGFYDKGESFGGPAFDQKKVWWTQAEGLNALLLLHLKFGTSTSPSTTKNVDRSPGSGSASRLPSRYWHAFLKQWEFIEKHMLDPVHGGWFAETTRDGRLIGDGGKANMWKANYHTARALMNVAAMLDKLSSQAATSQWTPLPTGTRARLRGLCVVSDKIVWASGAAGTYLLSTNGGQTWKAGTVAGAAELDFRDVHARDERTAFLLSIGKGDLSRIYQTQNQGETWTLRYQNRDPRVFLDALAFWDAGRGIALGDPVDGRFTTLTTEDGGVTWNPAPSDGMPAALPGEGAFAASGTCLVARGDGYAWFGTGGAGTGRVFRSTDRGRTWTVHRTPVGAGNPSSGIFSLAFQNESEGIAIGGDYMAPQHHDRIVALTADGGRTWTSAAGPEPAGYRSAVAYVPAAPAASARPALIAVGPTGSDISFDGGTSWKPLGSAGFHALASAGSPGAVFASGDHGALARFTGTLEAHARAGSRP